MANKYEKLVELWRITEMRDGAVYKTESEGLQWVSARDNLQPVVPAGYTWSPAPSSIPFTQTIRKV